ncbi:unnamed protein product [Camellia sinensis]
MGGRGGRGSGDAEDETPFALLDASCAYHDRFGKRHFVMPKYYRDPCGLVEDPSDNQTGYGLANARLLKWPALFIERVQMERLCRENRLKVPKARSVEIQKEDPDNVDRLCERLQHEISQMRRRLARDMQLYIVKKDAQKNRTEPNVAAIKGIMGDPELVSDAELSDYSDSEPPANLSEAESATLEAISRSKLGSPPAANSWLGSLIGTIIGNLKISISNSLQLERLAMYHDSNCLPWKLDKKWEDLSPKEWVEIFEVGINESASDNDAVSVWAQNRNYLVSPINGVLKYHHLGNQERNDPGIPFEKASLVLTDVSLTITEVSPPEPLATWTWFLIYMAQYHDWIRLLEVISRYKTYVEVSHLRPVVSVSEAPRLWWRYAAQATLQQKKVCYRFSWDQIHHLCQLRRRYIQLYAGSLQQLSNVNISEIRDIEKDLDPKVTLLWRFLAHAKVESVKSKEAAEQQMLKRKGWFSFRWYTPGDAAVMDASGGAESVQERLTKDEWQAAARIVNINQTEIVCGRFEQLLVSTKFKHWSTHCDVTLRFYGLSAPEGSLVQSVSSEQKVNALSANFVHTPVGENVDWRLSATISPCHVTVLMESYSRFLEFVKRSNAVSPTVALETATVLQNKIGMVTRRAQEQFQMVLEEQSRHVFALDIDLDAPKVRVPIRTCGSSKCDCHFLLDFGHFTLEISLVIRGKVCTLVSIFLEDIAAFFTGCGYDSQSCALLSPVSPMLKDSDNLWSVIDRCGMAVIVDQIKVPHPSYPSTRVSVQVPSLGIHYSPARYCRLMELFNILYGTTQSSGQPEFENFQADFLPWNPPDLATEARILVWRGIGYSVAAWHPCFIVLSGLYLYVLESEMSQNYQRCSSMAGKQVDEVPPMNVGGSVSCLAVSVRGMDTQKVILVIEFLDEEEKGTWLRGLMQATYRASAPSSVNILGDSEVHVIRLEGDLTVKMKLHSLKIKDELQGSLSSGPKYLACSVLKTDPLFASPSTLDPLVKEVPAVISEEDDIFKDASPDFMMSIRMSKLEFFCNRPTVVALIGFGFNLSSATIGTSDTSVTTISDDQSLVNKDETEETGHALVKGLLGYGKGRIVFYLNMDVDSVSVFLNKEDDSQLAMFVQESFVLDLKRNFRLCDMSLGMDHCWGWLCDIRNQGAKSLIKFTFNSYSAEDDDYEGYDYSLQGRVSVVRIVFLYRFVQEITTYFMELATPHTEEAIKLVDKVGGFEWLINKYEIDGSSALKLDLSLDTPIIIVPRNSMRTDWHGCPEKDPSAVHLDVLDAEILGINMAVGIIGCIGKPMIRDGQGINVNVRRSLRDVFRKVPTFSLGVKVGLLHAVMSDKEYNVILDCFYMNLSEQPKLPPSFRGSKSGSKETMRLLADKVNINSQILLSHTVTIIEMEVDHALLELCSGVHEDSPLAHVALEGLWVSYWMTSLSEADLYVTIPRFYVLDIRPDTKPEMRLMLGSCTDVPKQASTGKFPFSLNKGGFMRMDSQAAPGIDVLTSTMFLMPRVLVVPDFLLAVGEYFVPSLGAITGREELMDPKNDPTRRNNSIVLSAPVYEQIEDIMHLSPNRQLVADALGVDEYTYNGCGKTIHLSEEPYLKEVHSSKFRPIIILGRGKRLRFVNVKIENGSLLRKYTYLNNDSSYSVSLEDGVEILLLDNFSSNSDEKNPDCMEELSCSSNTSAYDNDSFKKQSFTFEAQVVSPEFTFYDSSKSSLDDSSHGEKLLRAKMDFSFMSIPPSQAVLAVSNTYGHVRKPLGFKLIGLFSDIQGLEAGEGQSDVDGGCSLWIPVAPPGYLALGCVAHKGSQPPPNHIVHCIRSDLVTFTTYSECIFSASSNRCFTYGFSIWRSDNVLGSFYAHPSDEYPPKDSCYDLNHLLLWNSTRQLIVTCQPQTLREFGGTRVVISADQSPYGDLYHVLVMLCSVTALLKEPPALGIIFRADNPEISAKTVQFTKVAHIVRKGLDEAFFWYPIAPPGYASLGSLSSKGSQCWSIWKVENQACTFLARSDLKKPSSRLAFTIGDSVKPKTWENITSEMKIRCFSVTVLDSLCRMMTLLFDATITNIKLATHGRLETMNAVLISFIAASTFNKQLEAWEPLVEPFDGIFKLETYDTNLQPPSRLGKRARVAATSILNINLSAANLDTFAETMVSWRRQRELEQKAMKFAEVRCAFSLEAGTLHGHGDNLTFAALDEDDFQTVIVENKLGCDIYLRKVEQNSNTAELLCHGECASVWVPPPRYSDRLNVADESREVQRYVAVQILEAKGLSIIDDGNSHNFFCALRLIVDSQEINQQKLFPQSARTKCVKPLTCKADHLDEGTAKWNELFIF